MKTYKVTQKLQWCCPDMLVFVDTNNKVIGIQPNPDNTLTQQWAEQNYGDFNPTEYEKIELVR